MTQCMVDFYKCLHKSALMKTDMRISVKVYSEAKLNLMPSHLPDDVDAVNHRERD